LELLHSQKHFAKGVFFEKIKSADKIEWQRYHCITVYHYVGTLVLLVYLISVKFFALDQFSKQLHNFNISITRTVPNGKGYNRNKIKQEDRRNGRMSGNQDNLPFLYVI